MIRSMKEMKTKLVMIKKVHLTKLCDELSFLYKSLKSIH